jgi:hypothetical protein
MNLIKGFDRIFMLISIVAFCLSTWFFFIETEYAPSFKLLSKWEQTNPKYTTWDEEFGEEWRKTHDIFGHPLNIVELRDGKVQPVFKRSVSAPPRQYLPAPNHMRLLFSLLAGLTTSICSFLVLTGLSRSIRSIIRWIASGFKG